MSPHLARASYLQQRSRGAPSNFAKTLEPRSKRAAGPCRARCCAGIETGLCCRESSALMSHGYTSLSDRSAGGITTAHRVQRQHIHNCPSLQRLHRLRKPRVWILAADSSRCLQEC